MKIKFDPNQDFQLTAINSIVNIFEWSTKYTPGFRLSRGQDMNVIKNIIDLEEEEILKNMNKIQEENDLSITDDIKNFSIEMETWTWKTYVYLRSIYELNRKYGLTKFIIIVPSIAIRAGVLKSLNIMKDHFKEMYPQTHINYFEYNSSKVNKITHFCEWNELQVMVITSSAFVRNDNIINQSKRDDVWEKSLMEKIASTQPILILDEPQSIEWEKTKLKLKDFNALFTLRYSATHKEDYSMIYKLTPWDAYKRWLVKQVWVASIASTNDSNYPSIECVKIENNKSWKLEVSLRLVSFDKDNNLNSLVKKFKVDFIKNKDNNLLWKTKNSIYKGLIVENINREEVSFNNWLKLKVWESTSGDNIDLMKLQIDKSLEIHFRKKEELIEAWIKPLCLFFIDKVNSFLKIDNAEESGWIQDYFINKLKEYYPDEENIDSYFKYYFASKKNKKTWAESFKDELKSNKADRDIEKESYKLIMHDKESLLSFEENTEFIFSHSALKEGWDNPNVFTICTLKNTVSETRKRQEIWRGMRLSVNQNGLREFSKELNKLTVVVNESYETFVKNYQLDLETNYWYSKSDSHKASEDIIDLSNVKTFKLLEDRLKTDSFKAFWNSINKKTFYDISFNEEDLINLSIELINDNLEDYTINKQRITTQEVDMVYNDNAKQFEWLEIWSGDYKFIDKTYTIDSILKLYQEELPLSKNVIFSIFKWLEQGKKKLILKNPIKFIKETSKYISLIKNRLETEGVRYYLSDESYEIENIFVDKQVTIDESNEKVISVKWVDGNIKSIYEKLNIDSNIERDFANRFVSDSDIKFFFKMPTKKFQIKTPMWNYSPDWGVVINTQNKDSIHFIVENKWTTQWIQLKEIEQNKIECTKKHFKKLETWVRYDYYNNYESFKNAYIEI